MTSAHTLADSRVQAALTRMFANADADDAAGARVLAGLGGKVPSGARELADAAAEIYMPISAEGGRLLYNLVRAVRPETVLEFGTSFGISTLYLAAAVRDNGSGRVVTTELNAAKAAAARRTFAETSLEDVITVLEGDALDTIRDAAVSPDFIFLDGWKDLCLPVLRLVEPGLRPGTLVVADDVVRDDLQPYLDYVRASANGYESVTFPVEDGMEISCRL
jgi:predicted O-methyltransferase YrrM